MTISTSVPSEFRPELVSSYIVVPRFVLSVRVIVVHGGQRPQRAIVTGGGVVAGLEVRMLDGGEGEGFCGVTQLAVGRRLFNAGQYNGGDLSL